MRPILFGQLLYQAFIFSDTQRSAKQKKSLKNVFFKLKKLLKNKGKNILRLSYILHILSYLNKIMHIEHLQKNFTNEAIHNMYNISNASAVCNTKNINVGVVVFVENEIYRLPQGACAHTFPYATPYQRHARSLSHYFCHSFKHSHSKQWADSVVRGEMLWKSGALFKCAVCIINKKLNFFLSGRFNDDMRASTHTLNV